MRLYITWLHRIQFVLLGAFAMLVLGGSIPILHPVDRFYIIYSSVLLLISIFGFCLLLSSNLFAHIALALVDIMLPFAFFSFLLLTMPFFVPSMKFSLCLPRASDVNLIFALIIWEIVMLILAIMTIRIGLHERRTI